nr:MAG TPA: hypothetical protein [Caudoviricetes sp.]
MHAIPRKLGQKSLVFPILQFLIGRKEKQNLLFLSLEK